MQKFIVPLIIALLVQLFKLIKDGIKGEKISLKDTIMKSGGMPSTHTTLVAALTAEIGFSDGINSSWFAICVIFSIIVIIDAISLRKNVGKIAHRLNALEQKQNPHLKLVKLPEKIGHKLSEVLVGALVGVGTICLIHLIKF